MSTRVIFNPSAGGDIDSARLQEHLACIDDCDVRQTTPERGAEALAAEAIVDGCEMIVSAGGDGTLNGVINGIAPHFDRVILGTLPLGTANDFCRSVAIPPNIDEAAASLCERRIRPLDVVRATGSRVRHFINVAAAGFSGLLHEKLTPEIKEAWGPLAYIRSGIATLPDLSRYETTIILDEAVTLEASVYNVIVANARYAAGGLPVAPEALLDDGLLDVIVVPASSLMRLAQLTPLLINGSHLDSELVTWHRAARVDLASTPGMWLNVDGELVGNQPTVFEVLPRALRVVVGRSFPV